MINFTKYYQAEKFLESIMNLPIKDYLLDLKERSYYLDRLRYLLKLLSNPQQGFTFIQVTGTAGKGSTANYLHEILNAANKKVGTYFSPHPTTSIERIKVNDLYISPAEFADLVDYLKPFLQKALLESPFGHPSYFETFLALALLYFKKKKCQYVILEAGLGGQHDATNVIQKNKLALITNINYEHTKVLGSTLKKIAQDKAGIVKKGSTLLTTETRPALLKIFQNRCQQVGAKFMPIKVDNLSKNKTLVQKTAQQLKIADRFIIQGLAKAKLPCRTEVVQQKPLVIIDGSHNPAKLKYLGENLKKLNYQKLYLIFGLAQDKNLKESLKKIIPLAGELLLTRFLMPYRKGADLKEMLILAKKIKPSLKAKIYLDPQKALKKALNSAKPKDAILITGSFFLSGELRQNWIIKEAILKTRTSFK